MERIQSISDEARRALADPELSRESLLSALAVCSSETLSVRDGRTDMVHKSLMEENHAHLVSLEVSHASLEAIKAKTGASPYGLSTKLTGAGGGGCAVSLVPDSECYLVKTSTQLTQASS